ncbi:MAG: twitching motility protein PilT [Candidatus Methanoplasma sp.]|jgi:rRNA-processing protein FCF1|nr:twitching motility protein PilT [Candidatus Methanoplasma sp.]
MQTVVLDTNALLMPFEIRINIDAALRDLLGDVRCVVPGPLIGELKRLEHKYAKAALELARKYEIVQTESSGDEAVMEAALATGGYVLTNDKDLRTKLRKAGVSVIYLRSSTHLVIG